MDDHSILGFISCEALISLVPVNFLQPLYFFGRFELQAKLVIFRWVYALHFWLGCEVRFVYRVLAPRSDYFGVLRVKFVKAEQGIDLIVEVRGDRLYSEGPSPTYPGTRDYILTFPPLRKTKKKIQNCCR